MKKTSALYILSLFATALLLSCEKPNYESESTKTEDKATNGDSKEGDNGNTDNGGWNNDSGEKHEWQNGDTVNVKKFNSLETGTEIWVKGYIAGCATGSSGYKYQLSAPFEYNTAILVADSKWETNYANCAAIQLKSGSKIRKDLNLVDNPGLHRMKVAIYGKKTTYLKLAGMKEITEYTVFEEQNFLK